MDEQSNLQNFVDEISSFSDEGAAPAKQRFAGAQAFRPIGEVVEIAGSGSQIRMDSAVLAALSDP